MHHFEQLKAKGYFASKVLKDVTQATTLTGSGEVLAAIANLQRTNDENNKILLNEIQKNRILLDEIHQLQERVSSLEAQDTPMATSQYIDSSFNMLLN